MKAAAKSEAQLADRVSSFNILQAEPVIELYLSGTDDVFGDNKEEIIENCKKFSRCEYIVHFPIYDLATKYIYDAFNDENEMLDSLLDFCTEIKSNVLIMHRCFGFNKEIQKIEAEERFFEKVILWNKLAYNKKTKILIENYGFVWLQDGLGCEYVVSPLDHFFPWDIKDFYKNISSLNLNNIGILLDISHAVLSSNMFNMMQKHPKLKHDKRFKNIYDCDLKQNEGLRIEDFIFDFIEYFHVSDSFTWRPEDGINDLKKYLYTENLPIGSGNIDFLNIFRNIKRNKTIIMEINPENGNHIKNVSQLKAVEYFKKNLDQRGV